LIIDNEIHMQTFRDDNDFPYYLTNVMGVEKDIDENGSRLIGVLFLPVNTRLAKKKNKILNGYFYFIRTFEDITISLHPGMDSVQHIKISYEIHRCKCYLKNNDIVVVVNMKGALAPPVIVTVEGSENDVNSTLQNVIYNIISNLNGFYADAKI